PASPRASPRARNRGLRSFPTRRSSDLGLDAEIEDEVVSRRLRCRLLQDDTAAVLVRLAVKMEIGGKPAIAPVPGEDRCACRIGQDRKSTRLNSSHVKASYAGCCLKKAR